MHGLYCIFGPYFRPWTALRPPCPKGIQWPLGHCILPRGNFSCIDHGRLVPPAVPTEHSLGKPLLRPQCQHQKGFCTRQACCMRMAQILYMHTMPKPAKKLLHLRSAINMHVNTTAATYMCLNTGTIAMTPRCTASAAWVQFGAARRGTPPTPFAVWRRHIPAAGIPLNPAGNPLEGRVGCLH